jgi:hypothetical protein
LEGVEEMSELIIGLVFGLIAYVALLFAVAWFFIQALEKISSLLVDTDFSTWRNLLKKEKGGLVEFTPITEYDIFIPIKGTITEQDLAYKKMAFIYNHLFPRSDHYQTRLCMLTKLICDYVENYKLIIKTPEDYEKIFNEVNNLEQLEL